MAPVMTGAGTSMYVAPSNVSSWIFSASLSTASAVTTSAETLICSGHPRRTPFRFAVTFVSIVGVSPARGRSRGLWFHPADLQDGGGDALQRKQRLRRPADVGSLRHAEHDRRL